MAGERYEVELRGITKRYGDCVSNDRVDLRVRSGSIHGVVGENGAGKSTLMKVLFGMTPPTEGQILLQGTERRWKSSQDAIEAGIGMVHQHFMLAGPASVLDNILLGAEPSRLRKGLRAFRPIDRKAAAKKLERWVEKISPGLDLNARIDSLPVGLQQRVEILKLLYRDARVLILDEPTAVLTPQETRELFVRLRELRDEGRSVIIITHKLGEVLDVTDEVTVLRGGRAVARLETKNTNLSELAAAMVGRDIDLDRIARQKRSPVSLEAPAALSIENLSVTLLGLAQPSLRGVSFDLRKGEILGVAGVDGNGQSELVHALAGALPLRTQVSGRIRMLGQTFTGHNAEKVRALPIGMVPEDRHSEAVLLEDSVIDNVLLGRQRNRRFHLARRWLGMDWVKPTAVGSFADKVMGRLDVRPADGGQPLRAFSGGNQQKVVVGREMELAPELLIAAQPTRGVDVGAIDLIHQEILNAKERGAAVLLVSSELDELFALADRIVVFFRGKIVGQVLRSDFDKIRVGAWMGGQT